MLGWDVTEFGSGNFAKPEVYWYVEQEGIGLCHPVPANEVLTRYIHHLL